MALPLLADQTYYVDCFAGSDLDRKSTRLNSSHGYISYAVFCLKKKKYSIEFPSRESTNFSAATGGVLAVSRLDSFALLLTLARSTCVSIALDAIHAGMSVDSRDPD